MSRFATRYETEIRLGLVVIVLLLLALNIGSSIIFQRIQMQLTEQVDQRLADGLGMASLYLAKNQIDRIPEDQAELTRGRFGLDALETVEINISENGALVVEENQGSVAAMEISGLKTGDCKKLASGRNLFHTDDRRGLRCGLTIHRLADGRRIAVLAAANAQGLILIAGAGRTVLYLAAVISLLVIPLALFLPRLILRPFEKMQETARSAGRLPEVSGGDQVAAVITSYETVIGELKRNEEELRRLYQEISVRAGSLEKFNQYLLQSIGSGVITVDLTGKIIGFNRGAGEILGHDPAEVIGLNYIVGLPNEDLLGLLIEAGLQRGETSQIHEIEIVRPSGSPVWLGAESSLIADDRGQMVGMAILFSDLTARKKLEAELEINRRLAALGEMTGGLAHQLRNSLAAISGFSQLLIKKTVFDATLADIAESIRSEAAVSEEMVGRFLNFARPLRLSAEQLSLAELAADCVRKCQERDKAAHAQIHFHRPDWPCPISGDPLLLREAIGNILDNALQAAGASGQVELTLQAAESFVRLIVADNGPGIPDAIRDKLFTPFFSSKPSGTGLGLALARKIITLHNGTITFDAGPEPGTRCRICLPALLPAEMACTPIKPAAFKKS